MNDVCQRMMTAGPDGRAVPFQKNLDKQQLMQALLLNGNGRTQQQQRSKKQNNLDEERRQMDEAERSRLQATPPNAVPASNTTPTGGLSGFLNYREKAFEEDDVMELEVLKEHNISFNLPEDFKEKKCPSCRKRFMFDDSLEEHLKECLQFRLVKFIREVYHLLFLKENRSISPFEFIRRAVFSIRRSVEVIASYDGDVVDEEEEVVEEGGGEEELKIDRSFIRNLEKLRVNYNREGVKIPSPFPAGPTLDDGRSSITSTSISPVVVPGVTRCDECNVTFETLTELETHNINYHRELPAPPAIVPEVDNVAMLNNFHAIATFLQQPANIPPLSSVPRPDVALVRNRLAARTPDSVQSNTSEDSSNGQRLKKVRCRNCRSRFSMIAQLDEHMVRCKKSPRGFSPQQNQNRQGPGPRPRPHSAGAGRGRGYSPNAFDRTGGGGVVGRNLNASYFYYMEQLKDQK
uniref:(northern house mosquito) hypothetical protein n=1 Tax=Culex pipiens TaxID=7175 RepID=A0A8D8A777_CULPI